MGGRPGWLTLPEPGVVRPGSGAHRLVIRLGADGALILEARGPGPWEGLPELACQFDLPRAEDALGVPPRVEFRRTLATFQGLERGCWGADVEAWAGRADRETRGVARVLSYDLDDGSLAELAESDHLSPRTELDIRRGYGPFDAGVVAALRQRLGRRLSE